MPEKFYLGFESSRDLEGAAVELIDRHKRGAKESHIPLMEDTLELFIPEMMNAFLVGTVDAIGLSGMATKVVHSTADVISKSCRMLVPQLLKKKSNQELAPMVGFVDEIYVRPEEAVDGKAHTGCEIDETTYQRIKRVISEIRAGNIDANRSELTELMSLTVDLLLDGMMKRSVGLLKQGFVVRKIADGAIATCQAAGHGVVNKVFKKLDDDQMVRLVNYFDTLLISAQR
ncbi:hypothetical protein FT643_09550 [Ketobacter sp. MCCC 1A13808]|uniref:hypothetical protein n=1 Tax=Ketobacter sp. MCCC 1A13808 TaxID=2602738 RepID=UPI000F1302B1|nr:hypothetical protein [Ketobacter sp. MCCC 1A13808]MVF12386.1 hypothetical protein [Ketobacter sp. MCCC 1A13808]RLP55009.1 MAG: hypothetical protein D6160_07180 [Ketobacter sp.]